MKVNLTGLAFNAAVFGLAYALGGLAWGCGVLLAWLVLAAVIVQSGKSK